VTLPSVIRFTPTFPVPSFTPADAVKPLQDVPWRRRYFLETVRGEVSLHSLVRILDALDPGRAATLPDRRVVTVYRALIEELSHRFPVSEFWMLELEEDELDEEELLAMAAHIPVEVYGFHWNEPKRAPLLITFLLAHPDERNAVEWLDTDTKHQKWFYPLLDAYVEGDTSEQNVLRHLPSARRGVPEPHPPRGRTWLKAWAGLPLLYRYCTGQTGYGFLDTDQESLDYGGTEGYPPLNLPEIHALERQWQAALQVWTQIAEFVKFVEEGGRERLELMTRTLLREKDALRQVTRTKPSRTLADVFAKETDNETPA
jgi:hypothetical protein